MAKYDPNESWKLVEIEKVNLTTEKMFGLIRILDLILPFFYHFICKSFGEMDFIELYKWTIFSRKVFFFWISTFNEIACVQTDLSYYSNVTDLLMSAETTADVIKFPNQSA